MNDGERARTRARHERDIIAAAEDLLATEGAAGLTLRGVASRVGLAPSAIYRYYQGIDALLTELILRAYRDVGQAARRASQEASGQPPAERALAVTRGVRRWALAHRHRYALIYGTPVPGYRAPAVTIAPASEVGEVLFELIRPTGALQRHSDDGRPNGVATSLAARFGVPGSILAPAVELWIELFGLINFELFGHLVGVVDDPAIYFDTVMRRRISEVLAAA